MAAASAFVSVPRLWPGETVVILGGGSSLTPFDVAACQGRARVIAVKEAFQLAPWADALYACDEKWWWWWNGAETFAGLKYRLEHSPYEDIQFREWPGVQVLRNAGETGVELDPTGLKTGHNSGYQAINLAVHFGAARIILLGFDLCHGPAGEQNWFGRHPNHAPSPYPLFLQAFETLVEPLTAAGVEVINASRFSHLRCFPQMTLAEALA